MGRRLFELLRPTFLDESVSALMWLLIVSGIALTIWAISQLPQPSQPCGCLGTPPGVSRPLPAPSEDEA